MPRTVTRGSRPWRVLAAAVLQRALTDAVSVDPQIRRLYRRDAVAFLRGDAGALGFWLQVLDADERQVRGLIAKALNGNGQPAS